MGCSSSNISPCDSFCFPFAKKALEFRICYSRFLAGVYGKHTILLTSFFSSICLDLRLDAFLHVLFNHLAEYYDSRPWGFDILHHDSFSSTCHCVQTKHWNLGKDEYYLKDSVLCFLPSVLCCWSCGWDMCLGL